jgi:hypothetical protein
MMARPRLEPGRALPKHVALVLRRPPGDLLRGEMPAFPAPGARVLRAMLVLWIGVQLAFGSGCQKTYYRALEKVGIEKRELLSRRVEKAKESQEEAQEEFKSALDEFKTVVGFEGGKLEEHYDRIRDAYESAEERAKAVGARIEDVESVARALFDEWEAELEDYQDAELRRKSATKLQDTRRRYEQLIRSMRRAEARLDPVLRKLHDHVLFLKHNLNAAALSSLKEEVPKLEAEVARLVTEMNAAVAEADRFLAELE